LISKATNGPRWLLSPNALSSSVLGLKMSEPLGGGWSLVGDFEFGFDPYSLELSNSPRSLVQNNGLRTERAVERRAVCFEADAGVDRRVEGETRVAQRAVGLDAAAQTRAIASVKVFEPNSPGTPSETERSK